MFFPDLPDPDTAPKHHRTKLAEPVFDPHQRGCDVCTLRSQWSRITSARMRMSGSRTADILALAEAPGQVEDDRGAPLIGPSGTLLREHIPGRYRQRMAYQNIVRCRPDKNRTPTPQEAHACSVYLEQDIASLRLNAIIGIGAVPLRQYFPNASIMRVHGLKFPVRLGEQTVWYYPIFHPSYVLRSEADQEQREPPALPVFRADLQRFFNGVDFWEKPQVIPLSASDVLLPQSYDEARTLIDRMQEPIGLDLETTKLRPYERDATLLTAAFSDEHTTLAIPINHRNAPTTWGMQLLLEVASTKRWVAHNSAFELNWLTYHANGQPLAPFDDSMAVARLYHERETALDLGSVSHLVLGSNVKRIVEIDTERIYSYDLETVLRYNGLDAKACRMCWSRRVDSVSHTNYQRILGSIAATSYMELQGLPVNQARAVELKQQWENRRTTIRDAVSKLHEVRRFVADRGTEFRITSGPDVGSALVAYGRLNLPMTAGGKQFATDEQTLQQYVDTNPLARLVLEHREATKIISTYIDPTLEAAKLYPDGNLHPQYTTMFVSTGRLSSRVPNCQNFPVRKHSEIRSQVQPPPGYIMAKFDYGQLEARILAMASKDRNLCQALINKFDIHAYWLDRLIDEHFPDYPQRIAEKTGEADATKLRKAGRNIIKGDLVFNALYGGGADSIAQRTGIPISIVYAILEEFWYDYREVKAWHRNRRYEYRDTGAIRTLTGRTRRGIMTGNEPINSPVQGTAADLVIDAMNELSALSHKEKDPALHPRLNVHDDLSFFLPETALREYIDAIHPVLVKVRYPFQIVPLNVEVKIGDNWAEMHDVATFEGAYVHD